MPVQLNIFLLLFGGLQGLLLSLFLARKRSYRNGYIFLIIYILVMLFQITMKVVSKIWLMENLQTLYSLSYRLPFLYGPLAYLLVLYLLSPGQKFRPADLLHFAPFGLAILVMLDFKWNSHTTFLTPVFLNAFNGLWLQLISIVIYHFLAYRLWLFSVKAAKNIFSDLSKIQFRWIRNFIILSFIVCVLIALAVFFMYIYYPQWNNARFLFVALTVFIYWISYTALSQPSVFAVITGTENPMATILPKLVVHRPAKKYSNSGISGEDVSTIRSALQRLMAEEKPYLNPALTINDLAASVKCNRHHLSRVLNESLHRSFYDYVNQYRIEEARQLLLDPAKEDHKIASIAYDAGFNSLSTFNEVFKKMTGVTPSQFKKDIHLSTRQLRG